MRRVGGINRIRLNRMLQNKTQFDVAKEAGVSLDYMSLIERGYKPKQEVMQRVEKALGLDHEEGGDEG